MDLAHFARWYGQSGTPVVRGEAEYDESNRSFTLRFEQHTPPTSDQKEKQVLTIPIRMGLLDPAGQPETLSLAGSDEAGPGDSRVLVLDQARQSFTFRGLDRKHPCLHYCVAFRRR